MHGRAARVAISERYRAPLRPCRRLRRDARWPRSGHAPHHPATPGNSGNIMGRRQLLARERARPATCGRHASSVTARTLRGSQATTLRIFSPATPARLTLAKRIAAIVTTPRSFVRAVISRPDSLRLAASAPPATTTHFADSVSGTVRRRARVWNRVPHVTRSATVRHAIPQ
jgi:hypothetical protein